MDCEAFVKRMHRSWKWMQQEAGLILTTLFLVFLIRTICVMAFDSYHPFFAIIGITSQSTLLDTLNSTVVSDELVTKKSFITGTEAVKLFRSHLQCFSDSGKWVYDPTPRHLPWNYIGDQFASSCDGSHLSSGSGHVAFDGAEDIALRGAPGNWSVREALKWAWQTNSSCPWRPMDRDDLCRQIGSNQHVMLVGDSLNHEISWAFMNGLVANYSGYQSLSSNTRSQIEPYEMCTDIFGEGKGVKISFVRNDRLSPIVNATADTWNNFYEYPWIDLVGELGIKTLLLNRGAHYEDDETYTNALHTTFTIISLRYPHIHVIYRNTQPGLVGAALLIMSRCSCMEVTKLIRVEDLIYFNSPFSRHLDCMNFTGPLSEVQHGLPVEYHWEDFQRQNILAKQIVEEYHYTYMDVYTMLSLRPEGHISKADCLHYCLPGPLDFVLEYFYNILLLI